eukprot:2904612-Amphidinium_carterae.1
MPLCGRGHWQKKIDVPRILAKEFDCRPLGALEKKVDFLEGRPEARIVRIVLKNLHELGKIARSLAKKNLAQIDEDELQQALRLLHEFLNPCRAN